MSKKGFAFLLARAGSKGLARKNIHPLGGIPLIEWTLDYLCRSEKIDKVCISTDDEVILKKYTRAYNHKIFLHKRPAHLSTDYATTEAALANACNAMKGFISNEHFGVYMQITEPFRSENILDQCIKHYQKNDFDSVFAATKYHKNFWVVDSEKLKRVSNQKDFNSPRQKKDPVVREDTGICLVADIDIFFQGKRIGNNPSYVFYDHIGSMVDIHNKDDIEFAEALLTAGLISERKWVF